MHFFATSAFLKILGWALVNSFWQFAVCWFIYSVVALALPKLTAAARHTLALLLLFSGTIVFIAGLFCQPAAGISNSGYRLAAAPLLTGSYTTIWLAADRVTDTIMPYCSLLYMACLVFLFIKFFLYVRRAGELQQSGSKMNAPWRTYVQGISARLGIKKKVRVLLSVHIDTPQVIGFLKPVILLPAACLTNLTPWQLEAVLLHELVHIKRHDYLVNLFVTSIEMLFFFNPFVKRLTAGIRKEREYSCDDMVIQFQFHPHHYASALLTLEKSRVLPVTYGIAAAGKNQQQLLTRIERILGVQNKQAVPYRLGACLLVLLLLCLVATVKPSAGSVDKFETGVINMADINIINPQYNDEANDKIVLSGKVTAAPREKASVKKNTATAAVEEDAAALTMILPQQTFTEDRDIQTATDKLTLEFTLQQTEKEALPLIETPGVALAEPYVPANSFSYQYFQDTSLPKLKGETYNEQAAKEALVKAEKALQQVNWVKIEKQLKYDRQDIAKLKNEIFAQLQHLNWQQINKEVQSGQSHAQMEKLQEAFSQDQSIQQYRQLETYYENLQKQLAEQELLIKTTKDRMQERQQAAQRQQQKLQLEMKKRRIIYI